jgi:hypothetical protein
MNSRRDSCKYGRNLRKNLEYPRNISGFGHKASFNGRFRFLAVRFAEWISLEPFHVRTTDYSHSSWALDNFFICYAVFMHPLRHERTPARTITIHSFLRSQPSIRARHSPLPERRLPRRPLPVAFSASPLYLRSLHASTINAGLWCIASIVRWLSDLP